MMNPAPRELIEGLGPSNLALGFSGASLYAAVVATGKGEYPRAAVFGIPRLFALHWSIGFTHAQFAAYRAHGDG